MKNRRRIVGSLITDFLDPRDHGSPVTVGIYTFEAEMRSYLKDINDSQWMFRIRREPASTHDGKPGLVEVFTRAIELSDVFSTSDANAATYVDREFAESTYGAVLTLALTDPGKVVLLHGPSKLGKTALWRSTIVDPVEIYCNGEMSLSQIYEDVLGQLGVSSVATITRGTSRQQEIAAELSIGIGKDDLAHAGLTTSTSTGKTESEEQEERVYQAAPNARTVAEQLRIAEKTFLFENYHRLSRETFFKLAIDLRVFMDSGVTTVLVGIPDEPYGIVAANNELEGRVNFLDFSFWEINDLRRIALNGQEVLNIEFGHDTLEFLAAEAAGSPLLMQEYCWLTCIANKISRDQAERVTVDLTAEQFQIAFQKLESTKFKHFGRIQLRLGEVCGLIPGVAADCIQRISDFLKKSPSLCVPLDDICLSNECCIEMIAMLNKDGLTKDLFSIDPDSRLLCICRPMYLPYMRWLT
ncbi:MAG: hypothetical protein WCK15_15890 [Pirellula sp.]